jgi:hypothetical protein
MEFAAVILNKLRVAFHVEAQFCWLKMILAVFMFERKRNYHIQIIWT